MGLLGDIFGGSSKSSSKSSQTSQTGDGGSQTGLGSSGDAVGVSNVAGDANVAIDERPVDLAEIESLINTVSGSSVSAAQATAEALLAAGEPVNRVAQAAVGAQSETGRIIGQLALPAALVAGLYFLLRRRA